MRYSVILIVFWVTLTVRAQPIIPPPVDVAALETDLRATMQAEQINGVVVLVMEGETVLYSAGLGENSEGQPMDTQAVYQLGGASEPFLALLTLLLGERHLLEPDTPVSNLSPAFNLADRPNATSATTLARLLTHTGGLGDGDLPPLASLTPEEIQQLEPEFFAGARFSYCPRCLNLQVSALQTLTQQPLEQLLRDLIFYPLHMDQTGLENGDIHTTLPDMVKWMSVQLQHGRWGTVQLAKPETIQLMQRALQPTQFDARSYYGYGWWVQIENGLPVIEPTEDRIISAIDIGDYQAHLTLIPPYQRGILILSDQPTNGLQTLAQVALKHLAGWTPAPLPTPERAINLAGTFKGETGGFIALQAEGDNLQVSYNQSDFVEGEWIAPSVLGFKVDDQPYSLYFTEAGRARTAILWQEGVTTVFNRQD